MNFSLLTSAIIALAFVSASAQSLKLEFSRVSAGGGDSSVGNFSLQATIGQPEVGEQLSGGTYTLDTGFLAVTLNSDVSGSSGSNVSFTTNLVSVLEDSGFHSLGGFASFTPPSNLQLTLVGYSISNDNPALFSLQPFIDNAGTLTFATAPAMNGNARVTVVALDSGTPENGHSNRSTNYFVVSVGTPNAAPIANDDAYKVNQDDLLVSTAVTGVLINDTDENGDSLTAVLSSPTSHGLLTLHADGSFSYRPSSNFFGQDSFSYRASDGRTLSANSATVLIDVYGRPTQILPGNQSLFSPEALRFSSTNNPANSISISNLDSRFVTNQVTLTVTNGNLAISTTNDLTFTTAVTNVSRLVMVGNTTSINAALASLVYQPNPAFTGKDTLSIVTSDEASRTNRDGREVNIFFGINALAGVPIAPVLSSPDKVLISAALISPDPTFVKGIIFNSTNSTATVLTVNGQTGSTNRVVLHLIASYDDGSNELVDLPVTFYQPLLSMVALDSNPGNSGPVFNPHTRLFEQKVSVSNGTPFDIEAFRISATNLPETVILENVSFYQEGVGYVQYDTKLRSGEDVTVTLQYFSADLKPFVPGLRVELLNTARIVVPPSLYDEAPRAIASLNSGGLGRKIYLLFPTVDGTTYYVQYRDIIDSPWITSPAIIDGNGDTIFWMDDGPPNTASRSSATRFYRVIRTR